MRKYFLPMVILVLLLMPAALAAGNIKINDFSSNITNGIIPLHTRFTGDVTGNVTSWRWIFENIGTGATTYSGSNITTHHNFGKPGIYNVTLNVWGPDGNDTLIKPAYITAMTVSTETTTKNKTTESVSINAKPKNETTESVISINKKSKKEASEPVSLTMNPNWESTDEQLYLDGHSEEYPIEVRYPIRIVNRYDRGYNIGYNIF
jgi:PKD repeat protein